MGRLLCLVWIVLSLVSTASAGAPEAKLWPRWQAHNPDSDATIDHSAFDQWLDRYVVVHDDAPNGVRYADVSKADRQKLTRYIETMEDVSIDRYNRRVQRAYWINLYNAETLALVLEHDPVDSIRDIGGGLFHTGPWDDHVLKVEDEKLTLNDIEHRILRAIWPDGLTHYGVNCASIACPSLRRQAYTGANVDQALVDNARDYVASKAGVRFDGERLIVSKIYQWYRTDFGDSTAGIISHLRRFAGPERSARLDAAHHIDSYDYDWSLNSQTHVERVAAE